MAASLRLIDWEYAGVGEPLFDLASVCVYHRYRRSQRERLLSAYAAPSEAVSWQRLELACWLFDYIRDLWMAVQVGVRLKPDPHATSCRSGFSLTSSLSAARRLPQRP